MKDVLVVAFTAVGLVFAVAMFKLYRSIESSGGAYTSCMTNPTVTQSNVENAAYDKCMSDAGYKLKDGVLGDTSREAKHYIAK